MVTASANHANIPMTIENDSCGFVHHRTAKTNVNAMNMTRVQSRDPRLGELTWLIIEFDP
jgi:hypothetical protein